MATLPTTQVKPKPNTHTQEKGAKKRHARERESRVNCLVFILRIPTNQDKKPKVRATSIKIKTQYKNKWKSKQKMTRKGIMVQDLMYLS